ncbi:hypothetical protein BC829DRAFT_9113 [Chytridium lagenaria]|nr:hypothetical protein BC829DRAFT_9113 [Chytridium lagenaria]
MGNTQSSPATCSPAWFRSVNPPNHAPLRDSLVSSDQRPMDAMMSPRESLVLPSSDGVVDGRRSLSSFRFRSVLGFSQPGSWFRRSYSSQRVDPVPDVDPAPQESHIHTKMPNTSSPAYAGNASSAIDDESNNLAPTKIEVTSDAEDSTVTLADSAETNTASPYSETTPTPQNAPSGSDTDTSPPIVPENGELPNSVPTFDEAEEEPFEDPVEHHAEEHLIPGADHTITEPSHSAIVEETADIAIDAVDENHLTSSGLMAEAEPSQLPRASGSAPEVGDQPDDEEDSLNFMSDDEDSTVRGLEESENGSQSQTTSSSNPTQQSNGDQPRSVLPEEVLGNIVRFAMMSALRRSLMNSQRPGPTDSSLETEPTASNPLPQNRLNTDTFFGSRPPPLMVIGIPSSDSETDRNSSDTTSEEQDATASGTQNDGNQPNLTSRGMQTARRILTRRLLHQGLISMQPLWLLSYRRRTLNPLIYRFARTWNHRYRHYSRGQIRQQEALKGTSLK